LKLGGFNLPCFSSGQNSKPIEKNQSQFNSSCEGFLKFLNSPDFSQAKKDIEIRTKQLLLDEFEKSEKAKTQDIANLASRKSQIQDELRQYQLKVGKLVLTFYEEVHKFASSHSA
jgi:hypothetical protein